MVLLSNFVLKKYITYLVEIYFSNDRFIKMEFLHVLSIKRPWVASSHTLDCFLTIMSLFQVSYTVLWFWLAHNSIYDHYPSSKHSLFALWKYSPTYLENNCKCNGIQARGRRRMCLPPPRVHYRKHWSGRHLNMTSEIDNQLYLQSTV